MKRGLTRIAVALAAAALLLSVVVPAHPSASPSANVQASRDTRRVPKPSDPAVVTAALTGTYEGTLVSNIKELSGPATITISGDRFTIETNSGKQEGRITAAKTGSYIGAALRFEELNKVVSVSVKRTSYDDLILSSVTGESMLFRFKPRPKPPHPPR